ncbi:MAG: SpoIID/LytB domain-containing protein [Bacillota bacterium]
MKRIFIFFIALIIAVFPVASHGRESIEVDYIDVRIGKTYSSLERVKLTSEDGYILFQKNDKDEELLLIPADTLYISLSLGRYDEIDVYDESNTYVTTLPANGSVLFGGEEYDGNIIDVNGKGYRGYISFLGSRNGLSVINHIDIESYLYGVVPKEIPAMSGHEALKAQSIAARGYTYSTLMRHANEGYNVCDTTHCQAYGGYESEHYNTSLAVDDTRGLVASYDGVVANTVFHSSSGGHTESSENVWGGKVPYLVGIEDSFSLNTVNSNWTVQTDVNELNNKLLAGGIDVGEIENIEIAEKSDSGRVVQMVFIGSSGDVAITGDRFRSILGSTNIKSTLFNIEGSSDQNDSDDVVIYATTDSRIQRLDIDRVDISIISGDGRIRSYRSDSLSVIGNGGIIAYSSPETIDISRGGIVISGRGYGHGIGMSQYGAIEMAKLGYDFEEILKYYYTGIEITKY